MNDLLKGDGSYTREELEKEYRMRIPAFTEYYRLLSAIPKAWKKIITARESMEEINAEDNKLIDRIHGNSKPVKWCETRSCSRTDSNPQQQGYKMVRITAE